ncbi:MAG: hypothetical protein H7A55_21020 [Verrucomicrobiaceae bacterium]|nr:hypothetical protein [Verrucomicrobiaceae bacterium]
MNASAFTLRAAFGSRSRSTRLPVPRCGIVVRAEIGAAPGPADAGLEAQVARRVFGGGIGGFRWSWHFSNFPWGSGYQSVYGS